MFYCRGHGHYSDAFTIFDQSDLKELSYEKIMDEIRKHIENLKSHCNKHFKKIDFIDKHAEGMINDVLDVLKEYDCYNPGQLKYFLYDCLGTSSLLFDIGESLYINKNEYSSFLKSQALKRAKAAAGYREKEMRQDYKYWLNHGYKRLPGANVRALYKIENNKVLLQSYYTDVLVLDLEEKKLYKLWSGYSVTTLKHVNIVCNMFGFPSFNKKEWEKMKVDKTCLD